MKYCTTCKHVRPRATDTLPTLYCKLSARVVHEYNGPRVIMSRCEEKNESADCEHWEHWDVKSLFRRILYWFV